MDEFVELLKKTLEIANQKNNTPWGHINLFDDGTVTYETGETNSLPIAFYDSLQEFIERWSDREYKCI